MSEQLELTGVDQLADVIAWAKVNPEAWLAVIDWAFEDWRAGIRPSTRLYCCILRRPHFATKLGVKRMAGDPVLVNDHLSASMARYLNRLYPYLNCPTRERPADRWAS